MLEIILFLWLALLALGLGRALLLGLGLPRNGDMTIFALGLGAGACSWGMMLLGFAQGMRPEVIWPVLALLSVVLLITQGPAALRAVAKCRGRRVVLEPLEWVALALFVLVGLRNLLGALTPEMRHDPLDYHLNFPNLFILRGGFYHIDWHVFAYMPSNVESMYCLALLLRDDLLAKLIHCGCFLADTLIIYLVALRYMGRRAAMWSALFWLLTPITSYLATTAYIDLTVALWQFLALAALLRVFEALGLVRPLEAPAVPHREMWRWIVLFGVYSGLAAGSKYTVGPLYYAPVALTLILLIPLARHVGGRRLAPGVVAALLLALALGGVWFVGPWLARNWIWIGNPVYPFFNAQFGITDSVAASAEYFFRIQAPRPDGAGGWLRHVWDLNSSLPLNGTLLLFFALVALPLFWPWRAPAGPARFLRVFLLLYLGQAYLFWMLATTNKDGRFLLPSYLALCLLLGEAMRVAWAHLDRLRPQPFLVRVLPWLLVAGLLLGYILRMVQFYHDLGDSPWPVLGRERQDAYRAARQPDLPLLRFAEANLPHEVLIFGGSFPMRRPYISHVKYGIHPVERHLEQDTGLPAYLDAMRQAGITHVLTPGRVTLPAWVVEALPHAGAEVLIQLDAGAVIALPRE